MDNATKERIKRKFDISFVLAKENLAFTKYPSIYKLEQRHGVDLGQAYQGRESAQVFAHYIAQSQRREFHRNLTSQFYSVLMDGSTDKGRIENELFAIVYCDKKNVLKEVRTCSRYIEVLEPHKADAAGLVQCLCKALNSMGIETLFDKEKRSLL